MKRKDLLQAQTFSTPTLCILSMLCLSVLFFSSCGSDTGSEETVNPEIRILHAGSLSRPFKDVSRAFMKKYPQYNVKLEAHGSRTCARQITELNRPADVMGSADSQVILDMLMPEHADYCIDFATNEMIIMFNEKSSYHKEITASNWHEILLKPDVQYGHSDPNSDPCGYRTHFTWQLAEKAL